ncbi:hypothetical protein [Nostoc sp.]
MEKNYTFKFNSDTALEALKVGKYDPINFYEARLALFNLSVMGITVPKRENCTLRLKSLPSKHLSH